MDKRMVDNETYLSMLREVILEGNEVRLNVRGMSMLPFLKDGRDSVILSPCPKQLEKGDIVIFQRITGDYILHRIFKADNDKYYIVGDAQDKIEGPIFRQQIFGKVTKVCRNGKWVEPGSFCWFFYKNIWMLCRPFRTKLLIAGIKLKGKLRRS